MLWVDALSAAELSSSPKYRPYPCCNEARNPIFSAPFRDQCLGSQVGPAGNFGFYLPKSQGYVCGEPDTLKLEGKVAGVFSMTESRLKAAARKSAVQACSRSSR